MAMLVWRRVPFVDSSLSLFHVDVTDLINMIHSHEFYGIFPLVNKHSYWTWPFIDDFPIKNGDFP